MKKHSQYAMKFAVGLTILLGMLLILFTNEKSFRNIVADDIENISRLSSSIIYAEIDNSLTKPIFVGLTMANDLFLKKWLEEEPATGGTDVQTGIMQQYLMDYSKKYKYDSMFVVSDNSGVYYYQLGVNKVVSREDAHDVWYYDFVNSGKTYDLDVDLDEANNNQLTVFANCRITDSHDNLMGVVGAGIKMEHLQEMLRKYENEYDLKAFLINEQGLVQVDSVAENIERVNFFDNPEIGRLRDKIIGNKTDMEMFWYPEGGTDHCIITKYVDNLDWYIVVEKNTAHTQKMLAEQINRDLVVIAAIIVMVLLIISYTIGRYNRMLLKTASIDDVTNLPNVKMFQQIFTRNSKRPACSQGLIFIFDIDHFKDVNDKHGHLFGNTILYRISEAAKVAIGNKGIVARWGGDEFVGAIYGSSHEKEMILEQIITNVSNICENDVTGITISMGATNINKLNSLDTMLKEADTAMYRSKENGRNKITYF